jgi:hypothetical protein
MKNMDFEFKLASCKLRGEFLINPMASVYAFLQVR